MLATDCSPDFLGEVGSSLALGLVTSCWQTQNSWSHWLGITSWEPWSSGYVMRLSKWRLWVQITAPYTEWIFFTLIYCKNCIDVWLKEAEKEARDWLKKAEKRPGMAHLKKTKKFFKALILLVELLSNVSALIQLHMKRWSNIFCCWSSFEFSIYVPISSLFS